MIGIGFESPKTKFANANRCDRGHVTASNIFRKGPARVVIIFPSGGPGSRTMYMPFHDKPARFTVIPSESADAM